MSETTPRENLMLISLAGETQAVPADYVTRVLPAPPLRSFPLMPPGIVGVVAVAGKVVPVIDLPIEEGRELVLANVAGHTYAFRVDKALRFVAANDGAQVEARSLDLSDLIQHAYRNDLSANQSLSALAATAPALSRQETSSAVSQPSALQTGALIVETEASRHLLPLSLVGELKETLPIVTLPDSSPHLVGAAFYRDELIPVICLQALLGGKRVDRSSWGGFVVVANDRLCALAVKSVVGLSRDAEATNIVDLKALLEAAMPEADHGRVRELSLESQAPTTETPYLLVDVAGQRCAFPIASIVHIRDACRVVDAPTASGSIIARIAAIGGHILPVLDLHSLLGLSANIETNQLLELKAPQMGTFMVAIDSVIGIMPIAQEALLRAPEGTTISAIAETQTKPVWILEPAAIAESAGWSAHAT